MKTVIKVLAAAVLVQWGVQCYMDPDAVWKTTTANRPNASTIIRHKRYLDFLPKSRMFVSMEWIRCRKLCSALLIFSHNFWLFCSFSVSVEYKGECPLCKPSYCICVWIPCKLSHRKWSKNSTTWCLQQCRRDDKRVSCEYEQFNALFCLPHSSILGMDLMDPHALVKYFARPRNR